MELRRSYHHLHYISAIKGGKVVKVASVICGKPNLKFKKLEEIVDAPGSAYNSAAKLIPVVKRFLREVSTSIKVKIELPEEVNNENDRHICESRVSFDQDTRYHDLVDTLGMTLKQFKEKHKTKKRKSQLDLSSGSAKSCKLTRPESGDSLQEDDDDDLKMTLKSWKAKVKGSKAMKKRKRSHGSKTISSVKSEPISYDHGLLHPYEVTENHKSIRAEFSLIEPGANQVSTSGPDHCLFHHNGGDRAHNMEMKREVLKTGYLSTLEGPSTSLVTSEVCHHSEPAKATVDSTLVPDSFKDKEISKSDYATGATTLTNQAHDIGNGFSVEEDSVSTQEGLEVCSSNPAVYNMEMTCEVPKTGDLSTPEIPSASLVTSEVCCPQEPAPATIDATLAIKRSHDVEIFKPDYPTGSATVTSRALNSGAGLFMEEDSGLTKKGSEAPNANPAVEMRTGHLCLPPGNIKSNEILEPDHVPMVNIQLTLASTKIVDYADLLTCKESPTSILLLGVSSARDDTHTSSSREDGISAARYLQPGKLGNHDASPVMSGSTEHQFPCSSGDSLGDHNIHYDMAPHVNENSSLMGATAPYDYPKKVLGSVETESQECSGLQHSPERLFLARKTISPTSQEKLCRAMTSIDSFDNLPTEKCMDEICIEVDSKNGVSLASTESKNGVSLASSDSVDGLIIASPKRPKNVKTADAPHFPDQRTIKGKDKRSAHLKGSNKPSQTVMSSCKSIQHFSQSAITFSQQQMHDFDRLAGRLTNELRSLKEIMVEALLPEARFTPSYRAEVRVAVENVSKVEETAKKWLSIMNRDCNRFCKIMSVAEKEASTSLTSNTELEEATKEDCTFTMNTTSKRRKKITFADETGGRLCDIRVYDNIISSPLEPQSATNGQFYGS